MKYTDKTGKPLPDVLSEPVAANGEVIWSGSYPNSDRDGFAKWGMTIKSCTDVSNNPILTVNVKVTYKGFEGSYAWNIPFSRYGPNYDPVQTGTGSGNYTTLFSPGNFGHIFFKQAWSFDSGKSSFSYENNENWASHTYCEAWVDRVGQLSEGVEMLQNSSSMTLSKYYIYYGDKDANGNIPTNIAIPSKIKVIKTLSAKGWNTLSAYCSDNPNDEKRSVSVSGHVTINSPLMDSADPPLCANGKLSILEIFPKGQSSTTFDNPNIQEIEYISGYKTISISYDGNIAAIATYGPGTTMAFITFLQSFLANSAISLEIWSPPALQ